MCSCPRIGVKVLTVAWSHSEKLKRVGLSFSFTGVVSVCSPAGHPHCGVVRTAGRQGRTWDQEACPGPSRLACVALDDSPYPSGPLSPFICKVR